LDLYVAFCREKGRALDLKSFAKELEGYPGFTFHQNVGPAKWDTIIRLMGEFRGNQYSLGVLRNKLSGDNYALASKAIRQYLSEREISRPDREYHVDWDDSEVLDTHLILLVLRDLGIEIQKLDVIDSKAFRTSLRGVFKYIRHHIFKNDKKSIDINRLLITINKLHPGIETWDTNKLLTLINDLLDWGIRSCPDYYKQKFPKDWQILWQRVLDRRDYIQKEGVGKFLLYYYPDLVRRIFGRLVKNPKTIEKRIVSLYLKWVNQGNPAPILPDVILTKLGLNSKQLKINNFLGNKP
jgi:hypothetical protein